MLSGMKWAMESWPTGKSGSRLPLGESPSVIAARFRASATRLEKQHVLSEHGTQLNDSREPLPARGPSGLPVGQESAGNVGLEASLTSSGDVILENALRSPYQPASTSTVHRERWGGGT